MISFKNFLIESKDHITVYHGSPNIIKSFDASRLTGGHDQKGPGLYTSTEPEHGYGEHMHEITLDTKKFIKPNQKVHKGIIKELVSKSPHLEDAASDWHENHSEGVKKLTASCVGAPNMHEAMERVWYDAYKADNHTFINNASEHFHGTQVKPDKFRPSKSHYVVWNGDAIKKIVKQ